LFFVINIFCSCFSFGFQNNKNIVFFLTVIRNIGLSAKAETTLLFFLALAVAFGKNKCAVLAVAFLVQCSILALFPDYAQRWCVWKVDVCKKATNS
jgi:hypothetical protein